MKKVWTFLVSLFVAIFSIALFWYTSTLYENYMSELKWSSTNITINNLEDFEFVSAKSIESIVNGSGATINKSLLADVDLVKIRDRILQNKYIRKANVYTGIDGSVNVNIEQFLPILLYKSSGALYMFDRSGSSMIVRGGIKCSVPLITSDSSNSDLRKFYTNILKKNISSEEIIKIIYNFANDVESDSLLGNLIVQININSSGEVELIPRFGAKLIILCDVQDLDNREKYFEKLRQFYESISKNKKLERYSTINLKYNKQVVAKKY